jgi:PAS domain S-box-containing protein
MPGFPVDTARLLAAIVDSSDDAIISKDLDGIVTSWNRAAERMFGWTAADMIGQSIRKIIPKERLYEEDNVLASIRRGEQVDHFETERVHRDGAPVYISLTVSPIRDAGGRVVGASKIARDISEARRARQMLERARKRDAFLAEATSALASSLDYHETLKIVANIAVPEIADWCAIDVLNDDGAFTRAAMAHVNAEKVKLAETVRDRYEDPKSSTSPQSVIRTRKPVFLQTITDDMLVQSARGDAERLELTRALGLVSLVIVPMVSHDRVLGTVTLATAESGMHYAEEELRLAEEIAARTALSIENAQAYEQLETANRLKEEFLATLSHELRTPLNAVTGYARMLKSGAISKEKTPHALDVMDRNAASLTQIVEDVLDVSRMISGKSRLEVEPLDLEKLVRNAIASVMPAIDAKNIQIKTAFDSSLGQVLADPDRLQQVIWNLLTNAMKFTPRGGHIRVGLEQDDSHVDVVVSDSGIGIRSDFLPHIFERFRQAEAGPTRRHGGLGLGLAIARHLVEMHGGAITARSEGEGKGAEFRVTLPLMVSAKEPQGEQQHDGAQTSAASQAAMTLGDLTELRVLAVDDDPDALRLLIDILEAAGATVTAVNSAAEALEKLQSESPDVLVADLAMPEEDGFDLIKQVRRLSNPRLRDIPAAALTAYARSGDRAKSLRSGFQIHLAKPIDPVELVAAVRGLAGRESVNVDR